jgi:hypothetical protein
MLQRVLKSGRRGRSRGEDRQADVRMNAGGPSEIAAWHGVALTGMRCGRGCRMDSRARVREGPVHWSRAGRTGGQYAGAAQPEGKEWQ